MSHETVLVTGATGFLGSQAAAALLGDGTTHVVAPVRSHQPPDAAAHAVLAAVGTESLPAGWRSRLHQLALPTGVDDPVARDPLKPLDRVVAALGVDEVIHCAGCLSYTDGALLEAVNVGMTTHLARAASKWGVRRVVYISTAFSGGFSDRWSDTPERLHDDPESDPTPYTASKRRAEAEIAGGSAPYLILRPSIVIGESATGRYSGPSYGLYQLWSGLERFLLDEWHEEVHFVAPDHPLPLLHQDAFRAGLLGAREHLPDGSICHLTSQPSPDVAAVAGMFFRDHLCPARVYFHDQIADIDHRALSRANRMLLRLAAVNLDIASYRWRFETTSQDRMIAAGTKMPPVTLQSVERCQDAFFHASLRHRRYRERFHHRFPPMTEVLRGVSAA